MRNARQLSASLGQGKTGADIIGQLHKMSPQEQKATLVALRSSYPAAWKAYQQAKAQGGTAAPSQAANPQVAGMRNAMLFAASLGKGKTTGTDIINQLHKMSPQEQRATLAAMLLKYPDAWKAYQQARAKQGLTGQSGPVAGTSPKLIGPPVPAQNMRQPVSVGTPGWISDSKQFLTTVDTVFITGQGNLINGVIKANEGTITAQSLAKTGKIFENTARGVVVIGEVLDIAQIADMQAHGLISDDKARNMILCITVKNGAVAGATEGGAALGAFAGPAAFLAMPAGAFILGLAVDKAGSWVLDNVSWCHP